MIDLKLLEKETTAELIKLCQQGSGQDKENAFHILVVRFRTDLLQKCEIYCGNYGHGPDVAEIVANKTFAAFNKSGKFDFLQAKGTIDDAFKIYLFGIAKRELTNYYRQTEKQRKGRYDGCERIITELPNVDLNNLNDEHRVLYEVIQSLPGSHRAVYLTYKTYEVQGMYLPKPLQEQLRNHLGVQQNTIRTYKKEAHDKINQTLESYKRGKKITA